MDFNLLRIDLSLLSSNCPECSEYLEDALVVAEIQQTLAWEEGAEERIRSLDGIGNRTRSEEIKMGMEDLRDKTAKLLELASGLNNGGGNPDRFRELRKETIRDVRCLLKSIHATKVTPENSLVLQKAISVCRRAGASCVC